MCYFFLYTLQYHSRIEPTKNIYMPVVPMKHFVIIPEKYNVHSPFWFYIFRKFLIKCIFHWTNINACCERTKDEKNIVKNNILTSRPLCKDEPIFNYSYPATFSYISKRKDVVITFLSIKWFRFENMLRVVDTVMKRKYIIWDSLQMLQNF